MDKSRILQLVNKRITGAASVEETCELQSLLQKNIGVSDAHKILLHLYNIESLVTASQIVQLQKQQEKEPASTAKKERIKTTARTAPRHYLSPHFFIRNNLFQITAH